MSENKKQMSLKEVLSRFKSYYKDYIFQFGIAIFGMLLAAGGTAAVAKLVEPVLNEIFIKKDKDMLALLPYAIILVYFIKGAGKFLQAYYTAYIGQDIIRRFRNSLLERLLGLDMKFFHDYRIGELISRNINDIERIRDIVSNIIPEFLRELITVLALLGVVVYQSPELAFFALIVMPLAGYPLSLLAKRMKKISRASQEKTSDISAKLNEIFTNIELIKASNAQAYEHAKFSEENSKFFKLNLKSVKTGEAVSPIMETFGSVGIAVVIIIGGKEVIDGAITMGAFFSFLTALFMLYTPIKRISSMYNKMQDAVAAAERTFELLDMKSDIKDGEKELDKIDEIKFNDVRLNYGEKEALKGVSFGAKKGELIALVGASGGGKSSLMNLMMRFYDVSGGSITLDGVDLREFKTSDLRENIGLVTQRVYIFNDSVAKNVAYGRELDEHAVINALKMANAYDFVKNLEGGIYEILNEFGTNLSGGQRQRIAIARALYKNPQILIFDEATSALDNESEKQISQAVQNLRRDKILFVVAHRLSTIENADKIAVIADGKVAGFGSDSELLQSCQIYKNLKGSAIK